VCNYVKSFYVLLAAAELHKTVDVSYVCNRSLFSRLIVVIILLIIIVENVDSAQNIVNNKKKNVIMGLKSVSASEDAIGDL